MVTQNLAVDVGGVRLAYEVSGADEAPPLILLHGLASDRSSWTTVAPTFAEQWRVYVPDMRGHGDSDWPGEYSFELLRDDLLAFTQALGLEHAVIVGHSMGGVAAYLLAQSQSPFPQDQIAAMAGHIPGSRHVTLEVGHRVHLDASSRFIEVVQEFLPRQSAAL